MNKISKKEYNSEVKRVNEAIELLKQVQKRQLQAAENIENELQVRETAGENWNTLDDSISLLEKELKDLNKRWITKGWTTSEWAEQRLINNNID